MTHGRLKSDGKKERVVGLCTYEWQKGQRVTRKIGVICDREREREMIPNRFDLLWSQFSLCFIYLTGITSTLTTRPPPQPPPPNGAIFPSGLLKWEKSVKGVKERERNKVRECGSVWEKGPRFIKIFWQRSSFFNGAEPKKFNPSFFNPAPPNLNRIILIIFRRNLNNSSP